MPTDQEYLDKYRAETEEADRRVELIKLPRRKWRKYGSEGASYLKDKSFNKFLIDGEERGFLVKACGWHADWHIEDLEEIEIRTPCFAVDKNGAKRFILRAFKRGELLTHEEIKNR